MNYKLILNITLLIIIIFILIGMGQWIVPFVIGIILAYCFHYPARFLSNKLNISSTLSASIILVFLVSLFIIFAIFLMPLIYNATLVLLNKLSILINSTSSDSINKFFHEILLKVGIDKHIDIGNSIQTYINSSIINSSISNIPNYIINFLQRGKYIVYLVIFMGMTPIITFYFLKDWDKFSTYLLKLLNKITSPIIVNLLQEINKRLGDYIKGQLIICLLLSIIYIIGLSFINVKESLVCGLFSGFVSIAPFFGPCIGLGTTLAMSVNDFGMYQYLMTIVFYILVPFIDSNFITPKLIGNKLGISPVCMLFSICATMAILGTPGIFLSVPITVILTTICRVIVSKL